MGLLRPARAVPWRPAPWWQSALEGVVLVAIPMLLLLPSVHGAQFALRLYAGFGAAIVLFAYALVFARLRPTNPPAKALSLLTAATYLTVVVGVFVGMIVACLELSLRGSFVAAGAGVLLVAVTGQVFERATERTVRREGIDRSPAQQSTKVFREARMKAMGITPPVDPRTQESAVEKWARERRGRQDAERQENEAIMPPAGLELKMPGEQPQPRRVYGPSDYRPSSKPNAPKKPRKKRR